MCAINSAVPCGTGLILLILPRTDVLGYFHAVPSGLLCAPGEVAHCRWSSVNASGAVQIGRSKKPIWTSLEQQPPKTNGGNCAVH
jgi:hypothetical protein